MTETTQNNKVFQNMAEVRILPTDRSLHPVHINTSIKSSLFKVTQRRWQKMANLIARIVNVPACVIIRLRQDDMIIMASCKTEGNPYTAGETFPLGKGHCSEAIVGQKSPLLVADASSHPDWKNSPSFNGRMNSFYGLPINWENGELFGSLCVFDNKANTFDDKLILHIKEFRDILEEDLKSIQFNANMRAEQTRHTRKIAYQETHDLLTDLLNPYAFKRAARKALPRQFDRIIDKSAVGILNVNFFKKINQQYGYATADQVLQHIASLLEQLRTDKKIKLAGRYAGDKFSFLITGIHSEEEARAAIQPLYKALEIQLRLNDDDLTVTCTTGICLFPECGFDIEELIMKADLIQGRAKEKGGICFYNRTADDHIQRELLIQRSLEKAVHDDEIKVFYQPQIDQEGRLISVEALVRWYNSSLGQVSPDEFIPISENTGLIQELGFYIFETACRDIQPVEFDGHPLRVSINVSPKQLLQPDFCTFITAITRDTEISPTRITLEITENILLNDIDEVMPVFESLIKAGFGLSIDDFGTGYSSLKYLSKLPITEVKIDKSFIHDILTNLQNQLLVKSVIAISDAGHIQVVAEGVETEEQARWLLNNNCEIQQGWLYDKALPIKELLAKYTPVKGRAGRDHLFNGQALVSLITDEKGEEWDTKQILTTLNSGFDFYTKNVYEFLLYIHVDSGKAVGTSRGGEKLVRTSRFDQFTAQYLLGNVVDPNNVDSAAISHYLSLDNVCRQLEKKETYTVLVKKTGEDSSIRYKKNCFCYMDRATGILIYSCIDITDVTVDLQEQLPGLATLLSSPASEGITLRETATRR
jgi:diguanylate cyclase (GGDEF)-like protein